MAQRTNEAVWHEQYKRWQINVQSDGERRSFYSSTEGKKGKIEAEKKADKWLEKKNRRNNVRFGTLWAEFLEETKLLTGTENYTQKEQLGRTWILPKLKNKRVSAITLQDWQNCINAAYKAGKSKKTLKNIRGAMTAFYTFTKKQNIEIRRPEDLKIQKDAPVGERRILQPDDIKTLFSVDYITHYKKQTPCFFIHAWRFLVLTGLRRGELCGLKSADIKDGVLYVRRAINRLGEVSEGKTDAALRYMVLSTHALKVLEDQEAMLRARGIIHPHHIFPAKDAGPADPAQVYKSWYVYRRQHGIDCSLHEMRHTLVSVAKSEVSEELLKPVIGHTKNMDTFGVYGHEVKGDRQKVADAIDCIFDVLLK
jgi:integrase